MAVVIHCQSVRIQCPDFPLRFEWIMPHSFFLILACVLPAVSRVVGFECKDDSDCQINGAICKNTSCVCPPDHVSNSIYTTCLPIAHGLGAACTDNLQCSSSLKSGGFCNQGMCDCESGFHYYVGNCWKTSGLLEQCYSDENCFVDEDFDSSICSSKKICVCKEGYYQREYSSCRKAAYKPGDPCGISLDCKFNGSTCLWNQTCAIGNSSDLAEPTPETPLSSGTVSLVGTTVSKLGSKCSKSSDCPMNAECSEGGVCLCFTGFYSLDQSSCHPEIGANCTVDSDCIGRNTFCEDKNHCGCTEGHVVSLDRRYCDKLSRGLGWSCLRDAWCSYFGPNAECKDMKCACSNTTHYVPDEMYCWVTRKAGQSCQSELDCGISGMSCVSGVCQCQADTHPSTSGDICRPDSHSVGQNCSETIDCMFHNAACNATSGKCICASNYVLNATNSCVPGIGGPCNNTSPCFLEHSVCSNATCACADGYVPNSFGTACLPKQTNMTGPCQDSTQCAHFNADCIDGKCACAVGHHYTEGWSCYKDVQLGQACARNGECVTRHASCLKYVCSCDHGYTARGLLCSGAGQIALPLHCLLLILLALTGVTLSTE